VRERILSRRGGAHQRGHRGGNGDESGCHLFVKEPVNQSVMGKREVFFGLSRGARRVVFLLWKNSGRTEWQGGRLECTIVKQVGKRKREGSPDEEVTSGEERERQGAGIKTWPRGTMTKKNRSMQTWTKIRPMGKG